VIIAATGQYGTNNTSGWGGHSGGQSQSPIDFGTVSNCPSTTGGIDGTGGIYFAVLLCGGASVGDCQMDINPDGGAGCVSSICQAFDVEQNNWAIEGWEASSPNASSVSAAYFFHDCTASVIHHAAFINDIANNSGAGFSYGSCTGSAPGPDYMASVGNIAQKSNTNGPSFCGASMNIVTPQNFDTTAGTHVFYHGNFVWNGPGNGCSFDEEGFNIDSIDGLAYSSQFVVSNNIVFTQANWGINLTYSGKNASILTPMKFYNNTIYDNNVVGWPTVTSGWVGEFGGYGDSFPWTIRFTDNIILATRATDPNGVSVYALFFGNNWSNTTVGGTGQENIFKGQRVTCDFNQCDPGNNISYGTTGTTVSANFYVDPGFANTADLITNHNGTPNCSGFMNSTACMGYNADTRTLTALSTIADLQANCANCRGKGYQLPSTSCNINADYPAWLKGVVYLHWDGTRVTQRRDLVTVPCGL
jgi:hypothetical protein